MSRNSEERNYETAPDETHLPAVKNQTIDPNLDYPTIRQKRKLMEARIEHDVNTSHLERLSFYNQAYGKQEQTEKMRERMKKKTNTFYGNVG